MSDPPMVTWREGPSDSRGAKVTVLTRKRKKRIFWLLRKCSISWSRCSSIYMQSCWALQLKCVHLFVNFIRINDCMGGRGQIPLTSPRNKHRRQRRFGMMPSNMDSNVHPSTSHWDSNVHPRVIYANWNLRHTGLIVSVKHIFIFK